MSYPPQAGTDGQGNVFIPFTSTQADIPFDHWMMTTKKIFHAEKPIVIQSVIITNEGEVFIQYAEQVNDLREYPKESESLVTREEKRSYE